MKAVLCKTWGPPDALVVEDIRSPAPGKGHSFVVSVKASGVNFPDVLLIQNKYQFNPTCPSRRGARSPAWSSSRRSVHGFMPGTG